MDNATAVQLASLRVELEDKVESLREAVDTTWTLLTAIVIFFMQAGFSMLEAGVVRERAVNDVLLKNLIDATVGAVAWFLLGYMFATSPGGPVIGWPDQLGDPSVATPFDAHEVVHGADVSKYLMSYMYAITSATIVSGAISERTQQRAYILSTAVITGFIYPAVSHWLWSERGWLSGTNKHAALGGALDFAGGGAVHISGGVLALVAAKIVGPRSGRFDAQSRPVKMRGHSMALTVLGTLLLWIGWIGFNVGSAPHVTAPRVALMAARVAVRTTFSGSAGALAALSIARCRHRRGLMSASVWNLEVVCNGLLAGLVSITAGAPVVSNWAAFVIGAIGGCLYYATSHAVAWALRVDDVVDAFAVHGACGVWSLVAVGLLADGSTAAATVYGEATADAGRGAIVGVFYGGDGALLGAEVVAALAIAGWCLALGTLLFGAMRRLSWLRVSADVELVGIDIRRVHSRCAPCGTRPHRITMPPSPLLLDSCVLSQ